VIDLSPPRRASGALVLADIGGYTSFLRDITVAHEHDALAGGNIPAAYAVMSSLLTGIVGRLVPPFMLAKLEGDAVFAYTPDPPVVPRGTDLQAVFEACYADFRQRIATANETWTCTCEGCIRIEQLDLKFIVHAGPFVVHEIAGNRELVGPEVVLAHRLLKNEVAAAIGHGAYVLATEAAASDLGFRRDGAVPMVAHYEHYPPTDVLVYPLRQPDLALATHRAS
jgi:hypothetical protein